MSEQSILTERDLAAIRSYVGHIIASRGSYTYKTRVGFITGPQWCTSEEIELLTKKIIEERQNA